MEFAAFKGLGLGDSLVLCSDDCLQILLWGRDTEDRTKASSPWLHGVCTTPKIGSEMVSLASSDPLHFKI